MLLHGYEPKGVPRAEPWTQNEATPVFLTQGYAVAQSAYASQGWAVADAVPNNEQLRAYFSSKYRKPRRSYLVGFSLGGYVALASLEQYASQHDGALSLCGVNVTAARVFDDALTSLVAFDYFFPVAAKLPSGGLSDPASLPQDQGAMIEAIETVLVSNEASANILSRHAEVPRARLAGVLSLQYLVLREMKVRAGGLPVDNRATVYSGFGDDVAFNKVARRYSGDANAMKYLSEPANFTGRISKPLILQYNNNDPTIPKRYNFIYPALVKAAGHAGQLLVLPPVGDGHCDFAPEQTREAFGKLTSWVNTGRRPASPWAGAND